MDPPSNAGLIQYRHPEGRRSVRCWDGRRLSASLGSMALTLGAIVLKVPASGPAAEFWREALGFTGQAGNPDFLLPPANARPTRLHLDETDRTHLDLWVENS